MAADKGLHIVIVGGGLGGFAAALGITKFNPHHRVTILEAAQAITELGAGVTLYANGIRMLTHLGLDVWKPELGGCENAGGTAQYTMETDELITKAGAHTTPEELKKVGGWLTFHRGDLLNYIKSNVEACDRITIRTNARVVSLDVENRTVTLKDGETVQGDAVIGADGVRSVCRKAITGVEPKTVMTAYAYRYQVSQDVLDREAYAQYFENFRFWSQRNFRIVIYPVRKFTVLNVVVIVPPELFSIRNSEESWSLDVPADEPIENFKEVGCKVCDGAQKILDLARLAPHVKAWKICDREVCREWANGHCALLGDSAHAMAMTLGQGLNQAFESGVILGRVLADAKFEDIPKRLQLYSDWRSERATTCQLISRAIITHGLEANQGTITLANGLTLPIGHSPEVWKWIWTTDVLKELEESGLVNPLTT